MSDAPRTFGRVLRTARDDWLIVARFRSSLGNRAEAEDVAQEALARAFVRWKRVEGHAEAWVARVSANQALKLWRRHQRRAPSHRTGPNDDVDALTLTRLRLAEALESLPRRQREVLGPCAIWLTFQKTQLRLTSGARPAPSNNTPIVGLSKLRVILADEHAEVNIVPAP